MRATKFDIIASGKTNPEIRNGSSQFVVTFEHPTSEEHERLSELYFQLALIAAITQTIPRRPA
jgi:hypothetical protein